MSITATDKCFYCGKPINEDRQHVFAAIRRLFKNGRTRFFGDRFHSPCFRKFEKRGERPLNPHMRYEVVHSQGTRVPA